MALTKNSFTYAGGDQTFTLSLSLGYADEGDIEAYVVGNFDGFGAQIYNTFTFDSEFVIRITEALTVNDVVVVQRTVSNNVRKVDYRTGGTVTPTNLMLQYDHLFSLMQELLDGRYGSVDFDALATQTSTNAAAAAVSAAAAAASETAAAASEAAAAASAAAAATSETNAAASQAAADADAIATAADRVQTGLDAAATAADAIATAANAAATAADLVQTDADQVAAAADAASAAASAAAAAASAASIDTVKLAGIETGATADQTGAEIKALYEAEANAFTDAQFTKLAGIETGATADQTGAEIRTALSGDDGEISKINLKDYGEVTFAHGSITGGTLTVNVENGNCQSFTVGAAITTMTITNPTASDETCSVTLIITNGAAFAVTWATAIDWGDAGPPTLTASGVDTIELMTNDGGTTWRGYASGTGFSA